jgi:hypothetical protein
LAVVEGSGMRNAARGLVGETLVAILVTMWFGFVTLIGGNPPPMLLNPGESLVDEGVALVKLYGEKPSRETVNQTAESVVRYRWMYGRGTEGPRDNCVILYHRRRNTD